MFLNIARLKFLLYSVMRNKPLSYFPVNHATYLPFTVFLRDIVQDYQNMISITSL
jgi:hypothetical protein